MFPPLSDVCLKDFQNNLGTATENDGLRDGLEKWRVYCIIKYIAASILVQPEQIFIWTSNFYSSTIVSTEMETNRKGNWVSKDSIWHLNGTMKAWGITPISSNSLSIVKKCISHHAQIHTHRDRQLKNFTKHTHLYYFLSKCSFKKKRC